MDDAGKLNPKGDIAKLFNSGGSQAVRLPKAYRFEGSQVRIRREGEAVILEPAPRAARTPQELAAFWARIDALMDEDDPFPYPPPQTITEPPTW